MPKGWLNNPAMVLDKGSPLRAESGLGLLSPEFLTLAGTPYRAVSSALVPLIGRDADGFPVRIGAYTAVWVEDLTRRSKKGRDND